MKMYFLKLIHITYNILIINIITLIIKDTYLTKKLISDSPNISTFFFVMLGFGNFESTNK